MTRGRSSCAGLLLGLLAAASVYYAARSRAEVSATASQKETVFDLAMAAGREADKMMAAASEKVSSIKAGSEMKETDAQAVAEAWTLMEQAKPKYIEAEANMQKAKKELKAAAKKMKKQGASAEQQADINNFMEGVDETIKGTRERIQLLEETISKLSAATGTKHPLAK